ncbi:MAG: pyridoxamine kinase [Lachnospiraceae bacterium]|jgi:pyridoxine kinase|nr:pyridoxamine kinase [Lachnospiraceae bacterium]
MLTDNNFPASHNAQKKIAAINDLTGFGRCALTVALPIISHMKIQCCPVPTSILSNHTGFDEFTFFDYTEQLPGYIAGWKKLGLKFEGIMSGFLGSVAQIAMVEGFIRNFRTGRTTVVVDPVMGDHGKIYTTYTTEMCQEMGRLVSLADIVTPNITEGCLLTNVAYKESGWKQTELLKVAEGLVAMGPKKVVITGIVQGGYIANYIYEKDQAPQLVRTSRVGCERSGTGDIFAAIIAADAVNGVVFEQSVRKASAFVKRCILKSDELLVPKTDGVCFEEVIRQLR